MRQANIKHLIPSEQRATILSTALGYLAQVQSISGRYVLGGLFTVLALPVVLLLHGQ